MERQKMKKKGFTLVELLVVIAIIAMLLAILMPALGKVRQLAQRIMCGTNLSGIGKAILTYSTDDKYESFPAAGSSDSQWDRGSGNCEGENSFDWRNAKAFPETTAPHNVTLSSHLYLLVKYADVSPDQFICPGSDFKKFQLNNYLLTGIAVTPPPTNIAMTDVWDFGGDYLTQEKDLHNSRSKGHQSYSYQSPVKTRGITDTAHKAYPLSNTSNPATPVMADRNPFWQSPIESGLSTARLYHWDNSATAKKVYPASIPNGNSTYHQKDGQNVLFADQHSKFEKTANCGLELDNIYTIWGVVTLNPDGSEEYKRQCGKNAPTGAPPVMTNVSGQLTTPLQTDNTFFPLAEVDSYLVSDVDRDDGDGLLP